MRIGLHKTITNMCFFNELNEALSKAVNSYRDIIVVGDLNIDATDPDKGRYNYLSDFVDTFSLLNLINRNTCHKNVSGATIDIMLTNRPNYFQKTSIYCCYRSW